MTSTGSPLTRLRRALNSENVAIIDAAARDCEHVPIREAVDIAAVYAKCRDPRAARAAERLASRIIRERALPEAEAARVRSLVTGLPASADDLSDYDR